MPESLLGVVLIVIGELVRGADPRGRDGGIRTQRRMLGCCVRRQASRARVHCERLKRCLRLVRRESGGDEGRRDAAGTGNSVRLGWVVGDLKLRVVGRRI
ncbi:hypothetical protein GALMADRAFT_1231913 [Galerina marginata CBS 339.88]|uniref:Secreted protein n=1 Tax=Galerina marginata (strain CBS 339.88) TaxID=685588 RepID=A0A067T7V5_GALM3|nr:hypothetical protein GALMADRAFT_1231913 [Galerina marginata CBS 339.88]